MEATSLKDILDRVFNEISEVRESSTPRLTLREVGTIKTVSTGIANVFGLPGVGFEELIKFPGDVYGIAFNVDEEEIGVEQCVQFGIGGAVRDEVRAHGEQQDHASVFYGCGMSKQGEDGCPLWLFVNLCKDFLELVNE